MFYNPKKIFIFSTPRSGSTWMAKRISMLYGLNLINEPFRIVCGGDANNQMHHTKAVSIDNFTNNKFWAKETIHEKILYESLMDWICVQDNIVIKETNAILQIDLIKIF